GGPDHQDQPPPEHDEVLQDGRHGELIQVRQLARDIAHHQGDVTPLVENVDAEPAQSGLGNGEVDLELAIELLELLLRHQLHCRLAHHLRRQLELVHRHDLALDLDLDRGEAGHEEVRSLLLDHQIEKWLYVHPCPTAT